MSTNKVTCPVQHQNSSEESKSSDEVIEQPLRRCASMTPEDFQRTWVRPDLPSTCKWYLGIDGKESTHHHVEYPV